MNLQAIVVANCFGITLMLMLLACMGRSVCFHDLADRIFYAMIWGTIALCALEMSAFLVDGRQFPGARALNMLLNTLLFAANTAFSYLWVIFVQYKLAESTWRFGRKQALLAIPALCVLAMDVLNLFVPVLFAISARNVYARVPLTFVSFLVSVVYLLYAEVLIWASRSNAGRYLSLPSLLFLLPILAGTLLQFLFYGLSLMWPALSIAVVTVYITLQHTSTSLDALSGVYTRPYLENYLLRRTGPHGVRLAGMMIDLDRFKTINDTLGHPSGDAAIHDFGRLLRMTAGSRERIARYGGDEFIVLREDGDEAALRALDKKLAHSVELFNAARERPYRLAYSAGFAVCAAGGSAEEFIRAMDAELYACKKRHSEALPERRRD